jgi:three-Cys-motif partner protein
MHEFSEFDDGLPIYECGPWTLTKLFFLSQYLATTTNAIVGNSKFSAVNYVDLFASNGICVVLGEDGRRRRYAGAALLAAGCVKPFDNLYLVEKEPVDATKLSERIVRLGCKSKTHLIVGDANVAVSQIQRDLPHRSLTVAFIDPFSLDIHFDSLKTLAEARPLDLIILFADAMDVTRNVDEYYFPGKSDKLDNFLGRSSNWREKWQQLPDRSGSSCRSFFAQIYLSQLAKLGYRHTRVKSIKSDIGPLYSLVYASKAELGLKFWDIAAHEDLDGNRNLWSPA